VYVDGSSSSIVVATSTWHHVVITDTTGVNASTFEIGRAGSSYFDGVIDDVRLYNRVLTASEVQRLYHLGATTNVNTTLPAAKGSVPRNHYTFDGPKMSPKVMDSGTDALNIFLTGGGSGFVSTTTAPGRLGQGLEFDGVDDCLQVGNTGYTIKTVSFWLKADDATNRFFFTPEGGGNTFKINDDGTLSTLLGGGTKINYINGETTNSVIATSTWVHVAVTDTTGASGSNVRVGCIPLFFFDGVIDDVRLYDTVLSPSEIKRLYQLGSPRGSLELPFAFDEDSLFVQYALGLYQLPIAFIDAQTARVARYEESKEQTRAALRKSVAWLTSRLSGFAFIAEAQSKSVDGRSAAMCVPLPNAIPSALISQSRSTKIESRFLPKL
jgi:hypothetical protein